MALLPVPVSAERWISGIADEWLFYSPEAVKNVESQARSMRSLLDGLDVPVAFAGGGARLMELARVPVAIEVETGLTDHFVARQKLIHRGRVGHEKHAPFEYVAGTRRGLLAVGVRSRQVLHLMDHVPVLVSVRAPDLQATLLRWEPAFVAELRRRGATVTDFPSLLPGLRDAYRGLPAGEKLVLMKRLRTFYFDHVQDHVRRAWFDPGDQL